MILVRPGNKRAVADKIVPLFPQFDTWIEPFFGAGGMYFSLPQKPKYAVLNDKDDDVYNLWKVVMEKPDALRAFLETLPAHQSLFKHWKDFKETDPIRKAARFLMLSNTSYMGKGETFSSVSMNAVEIMMSRISGCGSFLNGNVFMSLDFEKFFESLSIGGGVFVYADPPYLDTDNNYAEDCSFKEADSARLFDAMCGLGEKFAMSEFDHPFILKQAEERGLHVNIIGERKNMKNRRTEILVTNYIPQKRLFDF